MNLRKIDIAMFCLLGVIGPSLAVLCLNSDKFTVEDRSQGKLLYFSGSM